MTTAARPTFDPARGGSGRSENDLSALTKQYSSRDLPSHTKLKYRVPGQGTEDERKNKNYRKELEEKEKVSSKKDTKLAIASSGSGTSVPSKKAKIEIANLDADDPIDHSDGNSDTESSDDEDDTAALMAELQRIKKERAAEMAKKDAEKRAEEERIRAENILSGNPLLNYTSAGSGPGAKADMKVKRRWDEDVVFKNCARSDDGSKKGFINDCLRSEFHKKFMEKYIK